MGRWIRSVRTPGSRLSCWKALLFAPAKRLLLPLARLVSGRCIPITCPLPKRTALQITTIYACEFMPVTTIVKVSCFLFIKPGSSAQKQRPRTLRLRHRLRHWSRLAYPPRSRVDWNSPRPQPRLSRQPCRPAFLLEQRSLPLLHPLWRPLSPPRSRAAQNSRRRWQHWSLLEVPRRSPVARK